MQGIAIQIAPAEMCTGDELFIWRPFGKLRQKGMLVTKQQPGKCLATIWQVMRMDRKQSRRAAARKWLRGVREPPHDPLVYRE